ncbi:MAG TPA: ribosome-associated translation inhibitor RaiA [Anaerolineae bacterium]|nr:ribosome-associated translation inhibitor RaiA [Anaerolineae bacterium]HNU03896.1 ribosome-associated translation inhibitor RaiA [Anaerolineae bacterium]
MQLVIKGRNMEVNDRLREYVDKKIGKMTKFLPDVQEIRVELAEEKSRKASEREVVQVTMRSNGTLLRAEERNSDIYAAIDAVSDTLHGQINRFKGKKRRKMERAQVAAVEALETEYISSALEPVADEEGLFEGRIVRTKRFSMTPMNEEEAIDQMELLGHDFFIFYNAASDSVNVLYRRSDGNYGLLQPELA